MLDFNFVWAFILLPLPLLVYFFSKKKNIQTGSALKLPFYQRIISLQTSQSSKRLQFSWRELLLWLIWVLLIIAASSPVWLGKPITLPQEGRSIMLAVDISGSMRTPDMVLNHKRVNRLTAIKAVAGQFINARKGDRLGLILFGSKAYLQTPLTFDRNTVNAMLTDATIGLAGQMTAIGDAIGLSIKRLMNYPAKSRVLILLTDGSNNSGTVSPLSAAQMAAKQDIKIYTIGFGSDEMAIHTVFGKRMINPSNDLDEDALKQIAKTTGGKYFRAKDTHSLAAIYSLLNQLEPINADKKVFRPMQPLYPWPLGLALLLSVYLIGRRINFHTQWFSSLYFFKRAKRVKSTNKGT